MALSKKKATTESLVKFCEYADANGFRIYEMPPWDSVNAGHSRGSFHLDRDGRYGQAADINYGPAGTSAYEMRHLKLLIPVAQSYGLGITLAAYGTNVRGHRDHMHVDVGSYSNLGKGLFKQRGGDALVVNLQEAFHQSRKIQDNLLGKESRIDFDALRKASNYHGTKFPYGVKRAQDVVGTKEDGDWGPNSRKAHDETVKAAQVEMKRFGFYTGRIDGIWGNLMETGYKKIVSTYGR